MASVQPYGSGYSVRYWYETETGERKMKRVSGFRTKEDAWAAAKELEAKSSAGIDVNGGSMTCAELMERWFADRLPSLAATTRARYSNSMDKLAKTFIADLQVRRLDSRKFNLLMEHLQEKVSIGTAFYDTEPLRNALSWGVAQRILPLNPLAGATMPNIPKRKQRILSDDDVTDLVSASVAPYRRCTDFHIPMILALYGGLRREECAGLRWESVDFDHDRITIIDAVTMTPDGKHHMKAPKTDLSARTISMPTWLMLELKAEYNKFLARQNAWILKYNPMHRVCVKSTGEPYSCSSYAHALLRLIREINAQREKEHKPRMPEAAFHDLRHTHAAMLIRRNVQPKIISERLGHASIKITMDLYGYLMPGLQDVVADIFNKEAEAASPAAVRAI